MPIYKVQIGSTKLAINASSAMQALEKFCSIFKHYKTEKYAHLDVIIEYIDISLTE